VINRDSDKYIRSVAEWIPLPGSLDAIARLTAAGFSLAVVTNQSGVGRGYLSLATLADIHREMQAQIEGAGGRIAGVYVCPHRPDEHCDCRKPKPLLLTQAIAALDADASATCYIGDKMSDVEAARAAGVRPILVGSAVPDAAAADVERFADLSTAADALICEREPQR
jgi:D-glycero-D-manno-heptose 1,7-bisphosphate phosphatase